MDKRRRGLVFGVWVLLVFASVFSIVLNVSVVKASGTIYIRADGSVVPSTANITSVDNVTYYFTGNIFDSIVVERSDIIVDGNGYTLQGSGSGNGFIWSNINNVTIKNTSIRNFNNGICLNSSSFNTVSGNNITNNGYAIYLHESLNNIINENNIENNGAGIDFLRSSNNTICGNNIMKNNYYVNGVGIAFSASSNNTVCGNNIMKNYECGILIGLSSKNTISENNLENNFEGIVLNAFSSNNYVGGNNITKNNNDVNGGDGIRLSASSNNTISGNNITANNNNDGIVLDSFSSNNYVGGNNIENNHFGIVLGHSANNNDICENKIENNWIGIWLACSQNNTISENNIKNNKYGIGLYDSSNNNIFYRNSFVNNGLFLGDSFKNVVSDNSVNGKPLVYLKGVSDRVIQDAGQVVLVQCNRIRVQNLNLSNANVGVELWQTTNTEISGNNIENNNMYGIWLACSQNNTISENNIKNNKYSIWLCGDSDNNTICRNNIENSEYGVRCYFSNNNTISGNNITVNNYFGIFLSSSSNNNINGNNITNSWCGIKLDYSSKNIIYHNNFIDNVQQVETLGYPSKWDNGYPSGGNYWSNYRGADLKSGPNQDQLGSDGIGDTPYIIDGNNRDRYPLMKPVDMSPPITTHNYDGLWHTENFTITLTATDDMSGIAETYYRINDDPTKTVSADGQPIITTEGANNKLEYWSVDKFGNEENHHIATEIKLDKTTPTGSITINDEAVYTTITSVTLALSATDTTSGVTEMRFSNDNTEWSNWETYATSKSWTLTTDDGAKTIYAQFKDNAGLISSVYQDTITLDTTKPTANAGTDQTVNEDTLVTLDASGSSDNIDIVNYTWTFTDANISQTLTGKNPTYTFQKLGIYAVTLNVTDAAGNYATDTVIITVVDATKPVANAGQNQTVNAGTTVTFDAGGSSDNVGILSYQWDFGDGTTGTNKTTTHTYANSGTYTVTLTVKDAAGNSTTDSITVTVQSAETTPEGFPMWIIGAGAAITAIGIAIAATLLLRKRK